MTRWPRIDEEDEIDLVKQAEAIVRAQPDVAGTLLPGDEAVPVSAMVAELLDHDVPQSTAYRHVALMKKEPWVLRIGSSGVPATMVSSGTNFSQVVIPARDKENRDSKGGDWEKYGRLGGRPPKRP